MKDVNGVEGRLTRLLVSEHQVDPLVQVGRHVVALERLRADENNLGKSSRDSKLSFKQTGTG